MLPALRDELALFTGPAAGNGAPTWSLQDPARNLFFRIDWLTFEILSRWHLNDPARILSAVELETPIQPEPEDMEGVLRFLSENELVKRTDATGSTWFHAQVEKRRASPGRWLLHHYLFFRLPLWQPDAWLNSATSWVSPIYTRTFLALTLLALFGGLVEVSRQWDGFVSTLVNTFSWQGIVGYFIALILVKFLHELGHAFTAKRFGCRVPTMGVAFLVLFPMAYTDVNEVWKLSDKRRRLAVGSAGILTELTIAAWATLAWALLPDGFLRGAAFLLATTTWVSTLIINASPFLRFDGYFLLMDWLDLPNLHQRAFTLARWQLRKMLFGLQEALPEYFSKRRQRGLVLFAYVTWLYRLVVFGGIAVLVYTYFPKPLGPFLAAVEIAWFILLPIWRELKDWRNRLTAILRSPRAWLTLSLLGLALSAAIVPWDRRVSSQGLLRPAEHFPVTAPGSARIKALPVANGERVEQGQILILLEAPDLGFQQQAATSRAASLQWQAYAAGVDPKLREQQQVIEAARGKVGAEIAGIRDEQNRYTPVAPFTGRLYLSHPDLRPGNWVGKNEKLGVLADTSRWLVETYLPEAQLNRINVGDLGHFYSETPDVAELALRVERIDRDATRVLSDGILASTRGGELLVRESGQSLVPETALYRVTLSLETSYAPNNPQILRGHIVLQGTPAGFLDEFARAAAALFVKEAGF
jgi:putative peptide zinc metalloprotease protein